MTLKPIAKVVAITPCWNEPLGMIQQFQNRIEEVRRRLNEKNIGFRHFFLDDGALELPDEGSILVRHQKNEGLAHTLVDGYEKTFFLKEGPDIVVRLDCQEHDPLKIIDIVDHLDHTTVGALFLPICYWFKDDPRPRMAEITQQIAVFTGALSPIRTEEVLANYNQRFPLGYQAWRIGLLRKLWPQLESSLGIFEDVAGSKMTWGLDLLAILLAAKEDPNKIDFLFGGWSPPWTENRGPDKIKAQADKAAKMIEVARRLGCTFA
ncbi:MAG TPA: hypothetical protein VD967_03260 [Candidatus Paceibacterota bacterium]|nr:hypothetical protein [Candidatus Paceibacterota bacterium]